MTTPDPRDLDWWGRELERHARRASVAVAHRDALERELEELRLVLLALAREWSSPEHTHPEHRHALSIAADELRAACRRVGRDLEVRPLPRPQPSPCVNPGQAHTWGFRDGIAGRCIVCGAPMPEGA